MKRIVVLFTVLATLAVAGTAFAQQPRAEVRDRNQSGRIVAGNVQGDLTARENARLAREQARIQRSQARAASDGVVTARESRRIERQQDRASRHIYRARHNGRVAR